MTDPNPNPDPQPAKPEYSDDQRKDIDRQIAAARRQAEADAKARFEREAADAKTAADQERERKRLEEAGEFDKVRTSLESERDGLKGRAETAEQTLVRYEETLKPLIEERHKALPKEAVTDYPADAPALERLDWLEKRTALVASLVPVSPTGPRPPMTPKPNREETPESALTEEKKRLRASGAYGI